MIFQAIHKNLTCGQFKASKMLSETSDSLATLNELTKELQNGSVKKCPKCGTLISKNGGCNHMTCKCGHHWVWDPKDFRNQQLCDHLNQIEQIARQGPNAALQGPNVAPQQGVPNAAPQQGVPNAALQLGIPNVVAEQDGLNIAAQLEGKSLSAVCFYCFYLSISY